MSDKEESPKVTEIQVMEKAMEIESKGVPVDGGVGLFRSESDE